jgi:hypothetical protein
MAFWNKFPFTNFHEMNLDWLISTMKELTDGFNVLDNSVKQQLKDFNTTMTNTLTSQNTKINDFVNNYEAKVNDIPNQVLKDVRTVMHDYETAGVFEEIIKDTYGAVSYLNDMQNKKIVLLGDSLTDESRSVSWVKSFKTMLTGTGCTVLSYAKSGEKMEEQATRFEACTVKPDILWIWCGINDVRDQTSLSALNTALHKIRTKVQTLNPKCQVYLMSTYKNKRGMPSGWVIPQTAYWRYMSQYAIINGWTFIDGFSSAPVITPETSIMQSTFYSETDKQYLHYTAAYTDILARWILNCMINQSPVPLGDYKELVPSANFSAKINATSKFVPNSGGTFCEFGTHMVHVRLVGAFTPGSNSPQYTKICTLPEFCRPKQTLGHELAFRGGGIGSDGGQYVVPVYLDTDGSVYFYNRSLTLESFNSATLSCDIYIHDLKTDWERTAS